MSYTNSWGTDALPSLPVPPDNEILVDMGTLGFTEYGVAHNLTAVDIEDFLPTYQGTVETDDDGS